MLWFFATLLLTGLLIAACHAAGWVLLGALPGRLRPQIRASLSIATGMAMLILLLVPVGWFGPGFSHPLTKAIGLIFLLVPCWLAWRRSGGSWLRSCLETILLATLCTLPFTVQLLRFGAFDALNDPWTYMVQSQWLQSNSLIQPLHPDNRTAVLTQIYFTQITQTRAAAQFVLAFIQGLFGLPWAHQAYPVVIGFFFAAGVSAVTLPLRMRTARPRWLAPLFALLFATTLNGFTFGAMRGYLPQTAGLSLSLAAVLLAGCLMAHRGKVHPGMLVVTGMLFSAAVFTYSEILPFLVLAAGCIVIGSLLVSWADRGLISWRAGWLVTNFVLLANVELWRATKAIIGQAKAVVGEGIPWNISDFVAHAAGARAGYADGGVWWGGEPWSAVALSCIILALAILALKKMRQQAVLITPLLVLLGASSLLFVYYRFVATNPFPVGQGQSWSQFKLANWSSIFLYCAAGSGLGAIRHRRMYGLLIIGSIMVMTGAIQAWQLADSRTANLRSEVGSESEPFETLTNMAKEIKAVTTPPVFLDFPASRAKSRQLFAYLLPSGASTADWSDDVFVSWMLPESERNAARLSAQWKVNHAGENPPAEYRTRLGNYILSEQQHIELLRLQVKGGYPTEITAEGQLNWVRDSIVYEFSLPAGLEKATASLEAEIISIVPGLAFTVTSGRGSQINKQSVQMPESHQAWSRAPHLNLSIPLENNSGRVVLEFSTTTAPGVIGGHDQRELTFLIRNLRVWIDRSASATPKP